MQSVISGRLLIFNMRCRCTEVQEGSLHMLPALAYLCITFISIYFESKGCVMVWGEKEKQPKRDTL